MPSLTPTDVQNTVLAGAVSKTQAHTEVAHYTGCNIILILSTLIIAMHSLHFGFTISVINTPAYVILNCEVLPAPPIVVGNTTIPSNGTIIDDGGDNFFKPCVPMGGMSFFSLKKLTTFFFLSQSC